MTFPRPAAAMLATVVLAAPASAAITITQGASAPTYGTLLTFDEPGTPTGVIPADAFLADYGLVIDAGDGVPQVGDFDPGWGLGQGNSFFGFFGVFMSWEQDLEALSLQVWDPSGPPSPMGGGLGVFIFNDGIEVASGFFEPAWGGLGDAWFDISGADGMLFDEVRILGFGFDPSTYVDTLSWNVVPGPGAVALLGLAGLVGGRRRRG
jgi:hypothetical protein